jgi:heme/copper-type cytochrome/quinol oxidase subunit 2
MHVSFGAVRVGCWAVAVAALGATVGVSLTRAEPRPPRTVTVEMTAKRFAFVPARVEVIEGDEVTLNITSADGTHGVEIKRLKVKKEIPRGGAVVTLSFTAPAPGTYEVACSEYCGRGHKDMKAFLVVSPRGE